MALSPIVRTMRFSAEADSPVGADFPAEADFLVEADLSAEAGFSAKAGRGRSRNINTADKTNDRVLFTAPHPFFASEIPGPLLNLLQIALQKTLLHYNLIIWITPDCSCIIV